jgi:hypothetical protein
MIEKNRLFGNNVKFSIVSQNLNESSVAAHLGYSKYELWKIMDGRCFLDAEEKADIARELNTSVEILCTERNPEEYEGVGCIECRGNFSSKQHKKEILDLFDIYCDIQELIAETDN